jgi:hypothetical protein
LDLASDVEYFNLKNRHSAKPHIATENMISKRALQNELASRVLETVRLQHIPPTETKLIQHEELQLCT